MTPAMRVFTRVQGATRMLHRLEAQVAKCAIASSPLTQQRSFVSHSRAPVNRVSSSSAMSRSMTTSSTSDHEQYEQSQSQDPFANPEILILENALQHVGELGWSVDAMAAGAKDAGFPSVAHGMLPRGAIELVDYFMDKSYQQTRAALIANTAQLQAMDVADRLKFGVRARLQLNAPVLRTWPQAMALGALPQNAPTTVQKLAQLSDEIWYFAGDKSTDASWYTKRALLTGIYASTELFMLSDESPDFQETWNFLDRRVEETIVLGELPRNLSDVAGMVNIGMQSILSAAVSLAGPLSSQIIQNSPLGNVPNPISALPGLAGAGFPPNPLAGVTPPTPFPRSGSDFEPTDLREIDEELEKLGGSDAQRK